MGQTNLNIRMQELVWIVKFRVTILSPNVIGQGIVVLSFFFVYDTVYMTCIYIQV